MSLISAVRTFIATYPGLVDNAGLFIDTVGQVPTEYALVSLPGQSVIETYLNDDSLRQFQFALQSTESTADDPARLANIEFYEAFAEWIDQQNNAGTLPTLEEGKTANSIESLGQPILFELGDSGTGIYQLQCRMTYTQVAL
jgi:hypothetical protein